MSEEKQSQQSSIKKLDLGSPTGNSRRSFLKQSLAVSSVLAASPVVRAAHTGVDETIRVGLIGCGGRGTGAAVDAMSADPNVKLVAVGDTFRDRADSCLEALQFEDSIISQLDVAPEKIFAGFDAYKQVIDSGIDVVLLTSPPHFRPQHLEYAVSQGKHCFVEKPIAVDVPGVKRVMAACKTAKQQQLSIVSGLCWRYDYGVRATMEQIANGAIGDIVSIESSYNTGTLWHRGDEPEWSRMEYQIRNWLYYTWLSGDIICEQAIHSLDKTAWLLGDISPTNAMAIGGRQQRTAPKYGHIYDHFTVFYEYPTGHSVYFTCRQQDDCTTHVDELVHGTKGKARILAHEITGENNWKYEGEKPSLYRVEHEEMIRNIRQGTPLHNGDYMINSTMIAILGRMAAYTGKTLTWEEAMASSEQLGPANYDWVNVPEPKVAIPGKTQLA